jgi:hypothetical protein
MEAKSRSLPKPFASTATPLARRKLPPLFTKVYVTLAWPLPRYPCNSLRPLCKFFVKFPLPDVPKSKRSFAKTKRRAAQSDPPQKP